VIVFGLDMVIHRRAEIGTRYSSSINPAFHVFRGFGAVAWGIVFIVIGLLFIGYMYIWLTGWTDAQKFFSDHNGIVVALVGLVVTAWGAGAATSATYRPKKSERAARRLAGRPLGGHHLDRSAGIGNIELGSHQDLCTVHRRSSQRLHASMAGSSG